MQSPLSLVFCDLCKLYFKGNLVISRTMNIDKPDNLDKSLEAVNIEK